MTNDDQVAGVQHKLQHSLTQGSVQHCLPSGRCATWRDVYRTREALKCSSGRCAAQLSLGWMCSMVCPGEDVWHEGCEQREGSLEVPVGRCAA
eukprot:1159114-Pelagomonas_calceolata.AAC.2